MSRQNVEALYPLSPLQEGMLFHSLYAPEAGAYFEQYVATLEGELDVAAFRAAWDRVIARHPVLRSAMVAEGHTRPIQVVRARVSAGWVEEDWSGEAPRAQEERLREHLARDRERGFVLARAPLLRFFLARSGEGSWRFVWSYHHVLLDGWSVAIVVREVLALYEGLVAGREPELPQPRPFRDYIAWLQKQELQGAEHFWRGALSGVALPTPLGVDRPAPAAGGGAPDFAEARLRLTEEATRALGAFARAHHLTLNTLVQGAWGLLLGRYSGEREVVFGATVSGRTADVPGIDRMVGLFINTVPVRVRIAPDDTLLGFLRRLQDEQLHARQFDFTPLVRIQQWCGAAHGLFESILAFENYPLAPPSGDDGGRRLRLRGIRSIERGTHPLALVAVPAGEQLRLMAVHDRARLDDRAAGALLEHLRALLEAMAADPGRAVVALSLLAPGERARVEAWGRGGEAPPAGAPLHELVVEQARRAPGAPAVLAADASPTYAELDRRSAGLALRLRAEGVGPESRVGICAGRSAELVVGVLGVLRAGAAYVPLDPVHPPERLRYMARDAGAAVVLAQAPFAAWFAADGASPRVLDLDRAAGPQGGAAGEPALSTPVDAGSLAYVIYTSGSTGAPKGVLVEHGSLAAMARSIRDAFGFRAGDVLPSMASYAFDIWGLHVWVTLLAGGTVRLVGPDEVRDVPRLVGELAGADVMDAVPTLMGEIVRAVRSGPGTLPRMRVAIVGGEAVPPDLLAGMREAFPGAAVHAAYGPTEATIVCAAYAVPAEGPAPRPMVGRPLPGVALHVCDAWGNPLPPGVPGELWIGGAGIARGYGGRPDLTAERFVPDPFSGAVGRGARLYRTGDRVRWLPDGTLEYLGRMDQQVKVRGFRIEPGEVEAALLRHADVAAAAVVARDAGRGMRLVAYVVPAPGRGADAAGLRSHLAGSLPEYMVPSAFVVLEALPLNPNGKVDRRALPDPEAERGPPDGDPPGTPTEEVLCGLWAELLKLDRVGVGASFFELGGHSLLATQLASRVREAFGIELPLRTVFDAPTPAALAERVEALRRAPGEEQAPPLRPAERGEAVPLSFAQQRLWFLDQLEPGSALYNLPSALRLRGRLDVPALRRALAAVVRRHESLRTVFRSRSGEPVQVVLQPVPPELPTTVLEGTIQEREAAARAWASREAARPFDLEAGPLFRAELLRLAEDEHVLLLTSHHIVSDGWSTGVLFRELGALYRAEAAGEEPALPEPPVQYADYAVWQREWLRGAPLERQLSYWRERLAGVPALLELPTDRPRPAAQSHRGALLPLELPAELGAALAQLGRREGATLFMVLLAGVQALLARYTGEERLAMGTPIANRTRAETEGVVGFFANTVALVGDLGGDPSFRELLRRAREATLGAHAHQDLPFERLVEELHVERSLAYAPVFQVVLALQRAGGRLLDLGEVAVSGLGMEGGTARFDLELSLAERPGGALGGIVAYATDLFDRSTIERMASHLRVLLEQVAARPEARARALDLFTPQERRVLGEWNETGRAYPTAAAHELFAARAAVTPEAVAVRFEGGATTYARLDALAARLAARLRARGVGPETPVALCLERGPAMLAAVLGVLRAGGAYVPLDPDHPAERLRLVLEDAAPRLVLADRSSAAALPAGCAVVLLEDELAEPAEVGEAAAAGPPATLGESLAYVIYTSGSTGRPKGVRVTHASLGNFLQSTREAFGFGPGDVVPCLASYAFDIWAFEALLPLSVGATVHLFPRERVLETALLAEELRGCTTLHAVPALMRQLAGALRTAGTALPGVRAVFVGGDAVPPDLVGEMREAFPAAGVHVMYGPTEGTIIASSVRVEPETAVAGQLMGRPLPNARLYVCDAGGEPVPVGVPGEVWLGGAGTARDYQGRAELTAERFVPDPFARRAGARAYRTGDRARWRADGVLEFLGRVDRQVKVRGFRIEPGEVEAALGSHPGVREAVVLVRGEGDERRLVGYVEAAGALPGAAELRSWVRERVPEYMVPSAIVALERFPLTPTGKVDRGALPAPEPAGEGEEDAAPRTPTEEVLAGVWAETLGRERVGVHEDFFALGGHSLLATRVVSRVRSAFAVELPVRALFEAPTVAELAERVDAEVRAGQGTTLPPLERADRSAPLPLSFAQERLWVVDRLVPGASVYNMPVTLRLRGILDLPALRAALDALVERHESLRTVFPAPDGQPTQSILPAAGAPFRLEPLEGVAAGEREARALAGAAAEAWAPFDLAAGPLFRAVLFQVAADDHLLVLCQHHVVTDGWSMGVLFRELSALYAGVVRGEPSPLAPPQAQYADFAVWQRGWLAGEVLDRQVGYWRERLAGAPPVLDLPLDRPRPPVQTVAGAELHFTLPAEVRGGLEALARRGGATPFMALLAAWQLLLARYAGEDDVTVGTPIAGRTHEATEGMVGMFVNTLALRADLSGDPTFRELLGRVSRGTLDAYAHQDLPFERLVEELAPERSLSHHPLFQVSFSLQGASAGPLRLPGLEVGVAAAAGGTTKFDLSLAIGDAGEGLRGALGYATGLFDASTIERMAGHFRTLLARIVADPDARLSALSPMDPAETAFVVEACNPAEPPAPAEPVHETFAARAAAAPGAVAVSWGGERVSYAALDAWAERIAATLRDRGVGPEARVGICLERGPAMLAAVLGVLRAGAAYVPLDPGYPAERIRYVVADAGLAVLLTQEPLAASVPAGGADVVLVDGGTEPWAGSARRPSRAPGSGPRTALPESAAYLVYTSGSTGAPKGVVVEHRAFAGALRAMRERFGFRAGDVAPVLASFAFDIWAFEALAPLLAGGTARIVPHEDVVDTERLARELEGVSVVHAVPALMRQVCAVLRGAGRTLPGVRAVFVGGDAVPPELVGEMREAFPAAEVHVMYGPTEGTIIASSVRVEPETAVAGQLMGRPLPDTRLYVLDRAGAPVPVGVPGEVYLGGTGVARGYLGRADLTADRFLPDPFGGGAGGRLYRTGDRARRLADGVLEFLGRTDAQVKIRGFRIEPGEIEAALAAHPAVREAAVVAREDAPGEPRLVGYAALNAEAPPASGGELRAFLKERLPEHMIPAEVLVLEALPLTPTGKVDRRALPAPERPLAELEEELGLHRTPTEEVVAAVWADVLRLERVGGSESFFGLGGHSLLATRVVSRLRAAFGVELPVRALFEAPTVAELAERVDAEVRAGQGITLPPLERADRSAPLPLSFAQERLWVVDRLVPGASVYNMPVTLRLRGILDLPALRAALDALVERHESLRTVFPAPDGQPTQSILPAEGAPFRFEPLEGVAAGEREARALAGAAAEAWAPFDLAAGPLFRAVLFQVAADDHLLVLCQHHVVTDGWSMGVLFRELSALYASAVRGEPSPLAPPQAQYADFAVWQRGWLAGEVLDRQVGYWRERLAGAPPLLELPTDRPRGGVQNTDGASHHFRVPAGTLDRLRALARAEGATLFMTALAAFQLLLSRYSRQEDVTVGAPVAGRTHEAVEGMVGMFVNTLALRTDLSGDPPFRELLGRVREATLGAYVHQELPFEKLVDELQPERDVTHSPVFQVTFALQNLASATLQLPGLTLEPVRPESRTAKFDLALAMSETDEGLAAAFEYATALFDAATVERMAAHLATLLAGIAAAPGERAGALPLLDEAERRRLAEWNAPAPGEAGEAPPPVHEQLAELARRAPGRPALRFGDDTVTLAELERRVVRLAHRLRARGVGPETPVGIAAAAGPGQVVAALAVLRAGGAYVPLDPSYPADRLAYMVEDCALRLVLADAASAGLVPRGAAELLLLDGGPEPGAPGAEEPWDDSGSALPASCPGSAAYVIYTSGSTGRPKGVVVEHRQLAAALRAAGAALDFREGETFPAMASQAFDIWAFEVFLPLLSGGTVRIHPREEVRDVARLAEALEGADALHAVPALMAEVARALLGGRGALRRMRRVFVGGDAVPPELVARMREAFPEARLHVMYGPTEAAILCASVPVPAEGVARRMVGRRHPGVALHVCGPRGEEVPVGVPGELWIGGAQVARGYRGRPELTAERFVPDPFSGAAGARLYRTGDLVRRLPDGSLEFLGRTDQQVKVRGFRIEPGEIEAVLARHPAVRKVAALVREDRPGDRRIVAYLAADPGFPVDEARGLARASLPEYMVPATFVVLDRLPLTPSGKLDRRALPAPEVDASAAGEADAPPRTALELAIAGVWEEVLGVHGVGVTRGFFDLGGNSLLAVRAAQRLGAELGREVPVLDLFQHSTVAALARHLSGGGEDGGGDRSGKLSHGRERLGRLRKRKEPAR